MIGMIGGAGKANAGLAICVFGWILMAFAIHDPGIGLDIVHLGILFIGFCLLPAGLLMMIWTERSSSVTA